MQMRKAFVIANRGRNANCHFVQNVLKRSSVSRDRLVGLVVKASASRAEGPGFESR